MKLTAKLCRWLYNYRHLKLMLWCMFLTGLPVSAYSADLPTSVQEPSGKWIVMHPTSFPAMISSAWDQCRRDANVSESDALTLDKCTVLEQKLSNKACLTEQVPDGIVFDFLSGLSDGKSSIWQTREKATGREDRALLCDLGEGVYAYWFTGVPKQSCNNIAIVLPPPPVASVPLPEEVVVIQAPQRITFSNPVHSGMTQVLTTGIVLENCCCPTSTQVIGGSVVINDQSTLRSTGYSEQ